RHSHTCVNDLVGEPIKLGELVLCVLAHGVGYLEVASDQLVDVHGAPFSENVRGDGAIKASLPSGPGRQQSSVTLAMPCKTCLEVGVRAVVESGEVTLRSTTRSSITVEVAEDPLVTGGSRAGACEDVSATGVVASAARRCPAG